MLKQEKTVLITVRYLLNVQVDDQDNESNLIDKVTSKVSQDLMVDLEDKNTLLKREETSSLELNPEDLNCGRCKNCGGWVTDREKADFLAGLCNGATVEGKLLCDECLPEDHRWAF